MPATINVIAAPDASTSATTTRRRNRRRRRASCRRSRRVSRVRYGEAGARGRPDRTFAGVLPLTYRAHHPTAGSLEAHGDVCDERSHRPAWRSGPEPCGSAATLSFREAPESAGAGSPFRPHRRWGCQRQEDAAGGCFPRPPPGSQMTGPRVGEHRPLPAPASCGPAAERRAAVGLALVLAPLPVVDGGECRSALDPHGVQRPRVQAEVLQDGRRHLSCRDPGVI